MVGLMGGMLSNTFWKAVGGDPPTGGGSNTQQTAVNNYRRGHAFGAFHTSKTRIFRCPVNRNDDTTRQRYPGDAHSAQESDGDWLMYDVSSVKPGIAKTTTTKTTGGSRLAFNGSVTSPTKVNHPSPSSSSSLTFTDNDLSNRDSNLGQNSAPSMFHIKDIYRRVRSEIPPIRMSISPEINENLKRLSDEGQEESKKNLKKKKKKEKERHCIDNNVVKTSLPTTPGNCGSGQDEDEEEEAWPRQCAASRHSGSFSTRCCSRKFCHACVMASSSNTKDIPSGTVTLPRVSGQESPLPPEPPPVSGSQKETNSNAVNTCVPSAEAISGGAATEPGVAKQASTRRPFVGYREDIRAFDIYKITPHVSSSSSASALEAHYSRLPTALSPLTDSSSSDSDPEDLRNRQGLRKRKRKIPSKRGESEGEKRQRERESEDDEGEGISGLDNITVYTSPFLEDYTNRIAVLQRVGPSSGSSSCVESTQPPQRRVSFSFSTSETPIVTTSLTTKPPCSSNTCSSSKLSTSKHKGMEDPPAEGDVIMNDEDEDEDDEASTVVPEDFEDDDTDSDIEILQQSESWVDLSNQPEESPDRVTPLPFGNGEEYIRLLREAQRESNHSSARVSLASSRRDTPRDSPHDSPRSPPNSPNTELTTDPEEAVPKGVYINYYNNEGDFISVEKNTDTDWIWNWSSRPDQTPPKEWQFSHPGKGVNRGASIRRVMVGKSSLFSRDVLYTLLITNVLSLIIGTGIGIWLSKRSSSGTIVTLPIN